ncbi:MAG TPA: efflux RND transporter periplasmic adaptor subunit, partial [Terriglobales bacterium]|nr:efflux RND transporter periplasmic adaptor subunit [Terriglobales bacterium]
MNRTFSHGLLCAAVLLAGLGVACSGSGSSPSRARASAPQTIPVTVASVQKQDLPVYLNGLGSIAAYYTVNMKSRVDGQLVDIRFREGEFVKKGDLLAVIDPRPYQVQLEQAQAQLFKDQASMRDAQLNYERYKDLLQNSGAMSQQQVDTQKATAEQLEGAVRNDQATVDSAKLNLAYCHITAPESGRIGLRLVDPGNMVHASDANPMLVITQLQPITALFTLPEDQVQSVAQHMRRGSLEADAYSRDDLTKIANGKLLTIDNQIDQTTGTARLKA